MSNSRSRVQISKSFIDQWTQCVLDRMDNPPAKGTAKKIIEALLTRKLRDATKHISHINGRGLFVLTDETIFTHDDVIEVLKEIMENDIVDLGAHAPIVAAVTKTALKIYDEELNDRGIHFDLEKSEPQTSIPRGFKFWVLDETPERASKNRQIFKQIWRDKAHQLSQQRQINKSPNYPMFTKALTLVFDQFSDFNEDDFFDLQNADAVKNELLNKMNTCSAASQTLECLNFLLRAYDEMLKAPVFVSRRSTQTRPALSARVPK